MTNLITPKYLTYDTPILIYILIIKFKKILFNNLYNMLLGKISSI